MKFNVKKIFLLALAVVVIMSSLVACKDTNTATETSTSTETEEATFSPLTIEHLGGTTEILEMPMRIYVLDYTLLDIVDALGLGEYVVGIVSERKNTTEYLLDYSENDNIVTIETKGQKGNDVEEDDPYEIFYSIDADLIISSESDLENYDVLSEVAPTVLLDVSTYDGLDELFDLISENTLTIAEIWGIQDEATNILNDLSSRITELESKINGESGVQARIDGKNGGVSLSAELNVLLEGLGFVNLADTAPEELVNSAGGKDKKSKDSTEEQTNNEEGESEKEPKDSIEEQTAEEIAADEAAREAEALAREEETLAVSLATMEWVDEVKPEYFLIVDDTYSSLEEAEENGVVYPGVADSNVYKEGKIYFLGGTFRSSTSGITNFTMGIEYLESVFGEE